MKSKIFNLITRVTAVATIASSFYLVSPVKAGNFTSMSDTMTRLAASQTADHLVVFDLPTGVTFDISDNTDVLTVDFDNADFLDGGTWQTADFGFADGTATRTILTVTAGSGAQTANCAGASTANDIAVTVDTDANTFGFTPCGSFAASLSADTITIDIYGTTTTGTGTLTNSVTGSSQISLSMTDEGSAGAHSGDIYVYIVDSDQVTITADVSPSMLFDIDTSIATGENVGTDSPSNDPYTVALGTLSTTVKSSGDGTVNMIGIDLNSNATGGTVVTVRSASNNGLVSTSTPADYISPASTDLSDSGTPGYGICVNRVAATSGTLAAAAFDDDSLTATAGYDLSTTCTSSAHGLSHALSTTAQSILTTSSATVDGGRAEIFVKAVVSATTPAHDDYTDTLTFIATGTF